MASRLLRVLLFEAVDDLRSKAIGGTFPRPGSLFPSFAAEFPSVRHLWKKKLLGDKNNSL